MVAGLGSELFTLASSFDPYGAYKEGARAPAQQEIKDIATQEALKDARAEQAQSLGQTTGGAQPLATMAKSMLPPTYKLATEDGIPTAAGLFNQQAINSQQDIIESQKMMRQAKMLLAQGDDKGYRESMDTARRLQTTATQNMGNAKKEYQASMDDALESVYNANSQTDYDKRVKDALGRTGIPMPEGIPEVWTPDIKQKVLSMMSPATRTKIEKEDRAKRDEIRRDKAAEIRDTKMLAALQSNADGFGKEYKDVKGQVAGLRNYIPESEIKKLGAKEVPAVSSKLEAAELTDELATLVQQNPASAGLVASFYKNFDKFLPSRYDSMDAGAATELINKEADKLEKSGAPKDEVAAARLIAKKAVDVINARALAASGGGRVLVSELRLQKDVLGLEGLSPKSAVTVYRGLAESDRKATKRYGIDPATIKRPEIPAEKPAETKPASQSVTTREQFDALPSGTVYLGKDGKKYRKP
jgi:hypothetical protein